MPSWWKIQRGKLVVPVAVVLTAIGFLAQFLYGRVMDEYRAISASTQAFSQTQAAIEAKIDQIPQHLRTIEDWQRLSDLRIEEMHRESLRRLDDQSKRTDKVLELLISWKP